MKRFSFETGCHTKVDETSLPYYLFPNAISVMWNASASSKIWTRVIMSISSDDKHYITSTPSIYLPNPFAMDRI